MQLIQQSQEGSSNNRHYAQFFYKFVLTGNYREFGIKTLLIGNTNEK